MINAQQQTRSENSVATKADRSGEKTQRPKKKEEHDEAAAVAPADVDDPSRGTWGSQIQFILTCIGYAVGLGNIWRFPALAFENGGIAFLIPYLCVSLVFGLPALYFEMLIGQYTQVGGAKAYSFFVPAIEGVGWASTIVANQIAIYYNVIIGIIVYYMHVILKGDFLKVVKCANPWNTVNCVSSFDDEECHRNGNGTVYYNGACHNGSLDVVVNDVRKLLNGSLGDTVGASEEFLMFGVWQTGPSIYSWNSFNYHLAITLAIVWSITALILIKGIKYVGYTAYVTATVPYVIVGMLFVRGVTLDGAEIGIRYYLLKPDWSKILHPAAWQAAVWQSCFSLSVGLGGLLMFSSYNKRSHNCFRDALVVVFADSLMSIFGGVAVFSTLGFLAKQQGKRIEDVVSSGTAVAFVAYTEATARMPVSSLWIFLFMLMLFLLGVSSEVGLTEVLATNLRDSFPRLQNHKGKLICTICFCSFLCGLPMCTGAGRYIFEMMDHYTGGFSLIILVGLEIFALEYIYGCNHWSADIRSMMGQPNSMFGRILGKDGYCLHFCWLVTVPLLAGVLGGYALVKIFDDKLKIWEGLRQEYVFPDWTMGPAAVLSFLATIPIPLLIIVNYIKFRRNGESGRELFLAQPGYPGFDRVRGFENDGAAPPKSIEPKKRTLPKSSASRLEKGTTVSVSK